MNQQEIFDKAYLGVVRQGKPCISPFGQCIYRQGNLRCAAGHVMVGIVPEENEIWSSTKEIRSIYDDPALEPLKAHIGLLLRCQRAHDYNQSDKDFVKAFKIAMADIADEYNLTIPSE